MRPGSINGANQFRKKLSTALKQFDLMSITQDKLIFHKSKSATKGK